MPTVIRLGVIFVYVTVEVTCIQLNPIGVLKAFDVHYATQRKERDV